MHGHQGWNVWHGLCHIYMRYVYIWVVYSFCLFCCLFIIVTWWYVWCIVWASGNQEEVQACLVSLWLYHATVYIKPIPITNTKQPLQESSGSVVINVLENVMKMVLLLSVYIPMWSMKTWCSFVLKILLFSRMVCYIFQVIWSEVERTSHCMGLMGLSPACELGGYV